MNRNEMAAHDSKLKCERKSHAYITAEPKRSLVCYYRDTLAIYCTKVAYIKKKLFITISACLVERTNLNQN